MIEAAGAATFPGPLGLSGIAAIIAGSAVLRGFTGFGFGLAAVPLLGFILEPASAVAVAVCLQLLGGLADARKTARHSHWPSLRWLVAGALLGSPIGTLALASLSDAAARLVIAVVCLLAVALIGAGRRFASEPGWTATSLIGFVAGVFNGVAAMPGPPVVAFYMAMPTEPTMARASLVTFFTATAVTASVAFCVAGLWTWQVTTIAVLGFPLMLVGTAVGEACFRRGSSHHRKVSLIVLAAIAAVSGLEGATALVSAW